MKLSKIVIAFALIAAASSSFAADLSTVDLSQAVVGDIATYATDALTTDAYALGTGAYVSNEAVIEQAGANSVAMINQVGAAVGNVALISQVGDIPATAYISQAAATGTNFAMIKQ